MDEAEVPKDALVQSLRSFVFSQGSPGLPLWATFRTASA